MVLLLPSGHLSVARTFTKYFPLRREVIFHVPTGFEALVAVATFLVESPKPEFTVR